MIKRLHTSDRMSKIVQHNGVAICAAKSGQGTVLQSKPPIACHVSMRCWPRRVPIANKSCKL